LSAIERDANDNIYHVAIATVEAEMKDNLTWFLETLLSYLGPSPAQGWTFISDRQRVTFFFFFLNFVIYLIKKNTI